MNLLPSFQKEMGIDKTSALKRECWIKEVNLFQGGCNFCKRNKLKSKMFNSKNSLQTKIFFFVITKNSNWEILF